MGAKSSRALVKDSETWDNIGPNSGPKKVSRKRCQIEVCCVEEMVVIGLLNVVVGVVSFVSKHFLLFTR